MLAGFTDKWMTTPLTRGRNGVLYHTKKTGVTTTYNRIQSIKVDRNVMHKI